MESNYRALDGAKLVKVEESPINNPLIAVWHGGIGVNIYMPLYDENGIQEVDYFSLSNDEGKPVSREEMESHIEDYFKRERMKL